MKQFITIIILITFISFPVFSDGLALTTNSPIGEGKGIFPGRVVWMRDTTVAKWDGKTGRWWDDGSINLSAFEKMYDKSVMTLTGLIISQRHGKRFSSITTDLSAVVTTVIGRERRLPSK
jgi:hypothetical protein